MKYDAWFMDRNTNQDAVDKMLITGLFSISGKKMTRMHGIQYSDITIKSGGKEMSLTKKEKKYISN